MSMPRSAAPCCVAWWLYAGRLHSRRSRKHRLRPWRLAPTSIARHSLKKRIAALIGTSRSSTRRNPGSIQRMPSTRFRHRRIAEARCRVDWSHVNSPHNLAQTLARNLRPNPQELEKTPGRATSGSGRYTLAAAQNADGGWGYFPGKQSWLEPTVYALLALSAQSGEPAFARGWRLIRSWELPGGGWRGCAAVNEAHWATSLVVTLHAALGVYDAAFDRGVAWLTA